MALIVSLSFSIFAFGVSADGVDSITEDLYIDLMPFILASFDGNSREVSSAVTTFSIPLETAMSFGYIDLVLKCDFVPEVSCSGSLLTVLSLGNDLYRVYGDIDLEWSRYVDLQIYTTGSVSYPTNVAILSCNALSVSEVNYLVPGTLYVSAPSFQNTGGSMAYVPGGNAVRVNFGGGSTVIPHEFHPWESYVSVSDWRKYDYLDIFFYGGASSLISLHATCGQLAVPYSITYLDMGADSWYTSSNHYQVNGVASIPAFNEFGAVVRLDLTGVDRTISGNVHLYLNGEASYYYAANYVTLLRISGTISTGVDSGDVSQSILQRTFTYVRSISDFIRTATNSLNSSINAVTSSIMNFNLDFEGFRQNYITVSSAFNQFFTNWKFDLHEKLDLHHSDLKQFLSELLNPDRQDITDQSQTIEEQIGSIESAEQDAIASIENNAGIVLGSFSSVASFAQPIAFISNILQGTFNGLGNYQSVIMIPLALGAWLFICSRAPGGMNKPRRSDITYRATAKSDLTVEGGKD